MIDQSGCNDTFAQLYMAQGDDSDIMISTGMRGPYINLAGPATPDGRGVRVELLAANGGGFIVAHGDPGEQTRMEIVPGEEPSTFVRRVTVQEPKS